MCTLWNYPEFILEHFRYWDFGKKKVGRAAYSNYLKIRFSFFWTVCVPIFIGWELVVTPLLVDLGRHLLVWKNEPQLLSVWETPSGWDPALSGLLPLLCQLLQVGCWIQILSFHSYFVTLESQTSCFLFLFYCVD